MPFTTEHYLLEAFIDGDAYSALADKRRFSSIDNQFNAMATIVGDGRISGWEIQNLTFPNVQVTKGTGFIDGYCVATFDDQTFTLAANSVFYFYAQRRLGLTSIEGPRSDVVSVSYVDTTAPATPAGFSASAPTSVDEYFNIELNWTENSEIDLDHYDIERSLLPSSGFSLVATVSSSGEATYIDPVDEDETYYYRLYAVDQSGNRSTPATDSRTTELSPALPPNPMEVIMPYSEGAINILWKRPVSIPLSKIANFELTWVRLETDGSEIPATQETRVIAKTLYSERIDNLLNGKQYKLTLRTVDSKGRKSEGIIKHVAPQESVAPKDPQGISVTETELVVGSGNVILNLIWTDGADEYDPLLPYHYNVYITVDGLQESLPIVVPIDESSQQVELYTFDLATYFAIPQKILITLRLTSVTENGLESQGNYARFVTTDFGQPLPVGNLLSEFNSDVGRITVTWDNQPDAAYIKIQVIDDDLDDEYPEAEIIDQNIGLIEIFAFDASLNHRYTITVTPFNVDDVPGPSDVTVEITLLAGALPPRLPRDLAPRVGDRQVSFTWSPSPDITVVSYRVYRKLGAITVTATDWTLLDTLPRTIEKFEDYGLENNQIYSYYVTAIDLYGQESLHLPDGALNLNYIEIIPRPSGILTEADNVQASLVGNDILLTWESLAEEFDSFIVYRSVGNLHLWEDIATLDRNTVLYTDENVPLISGTTFYYTIGKVLNDSDIVVQISDVAPENTILLGSLTLDGADFGALDISNRRNIKDMEDPIGEYTNVYLLAHKHKELDRNDPDRIDLRPDLIITDWETVDGRIFTTEETDISGTGYVVKIDGRFPPVLFEVDVTTRRLIFSEAIVSVDSAGNVTETLPDIEVRVLGVEEVQGVLSADKFDNIHARQIAFGKLNREQMPGINHEGRIRETLLPKSYLLERYSDHSFIVPQGNVDETKTFGDGTTFYAIIEGDGLIDEVIDWDQEDDGDVVGFRSPNFAVDTLTNLKQNADTTVTVASRNDVANDLRFQPNQIFAQNGAVTQSLRRSFTVDATAPVNVNEIGLTSISTEDSCFDTDRNELLYINNAFGANARVYTVDPISGQQRFWGFIPKHSQGDDFGVASIEYNSVDGKLYVIWKTPAFLVTLDLNNIDGSDMISMTEIGSQAMYTGSGFSTSFFGMAHDSTNNIMYAVSSLGTGATRLWTVNLATGIASLVHATNLLTADFDSLTYDATADKLYGLDGFIGSGSFDGELYDIDRSTGLDTGLGTFDTPFDEGATAIAAPPADNSLWQSGDYLAGRETLNLGITPGLHSDIYLRFPIDLPPAAVIGAATFEVQAHDTEGYSQGDIDLRVSALDPALYIDAIDLTFEALKSVGTIYSQLWSPPDWDMDERSENTQLNIRALLQAFIDSQAYSRNRHIVLKIETLSTTTFGSERMIHPSGDNKAPTIEHNYVLSGAEVTDDEAFQSEKSYRISFEFEDTQPTRWVRVTSFDAPIKPNPVIDLKKRLKFRVLLTEGSIYLALGIREIVATNVEAGDNGGTTGPIEWVGATDFVTDSDGNIAPLGVLIQASSEWQLIEFDLEKAPVIAYSSDSNGILDGSFGVLEHLAFTLDPAATNPTGPFEIYIDKLEQVDDVLAAGTSQGILLSRDFGTSWDSVRFVETPVHKFYRATNNPFIWAVATNTVLIAVDPENWFETSGLTGVQYIRDIAEDELGNMFVSTDKGVYWFEIALINNFSSWRQTQPINAFTTDAYGLYHNPVASGIDEIWVSTEIGIYKTTNQGETWVDTNINTQGLPAYQFINISSDHLLPNVICITRKHVLRKLGAESDFSVLANMEVQHDIFDIWNMEYFSGRLYVSTGSGVYSNAMDELFVPSITTTFDRILPGLNINGRVGVAFGLDAVTVDTGVRQLFIGQENRLMMADEDNVLSIKEQFPNKELPSFFQNGAELDTGYVYNAFNNVLVFREPQPVNKIYRSANIPRKIFVPTNGGWSQTNPEADVFIHFNGLPKWLDFKLDEADILGELQNLQGKLAPIEGTLNDFNSLDPDATNKLAEVLADITNMIQGGEDDTSLLNNTTIIQFMEDYTRFLSLITNAVVLDNGLDSFPPINITGFPATQREANSRADLLEAQENFTANNSTGINIDTVTGNVDFLSVFTTTTELEQRQEYVFDKYDRMEITVFNANVSGIGEFTHRELEDQMEAVNSGLSSHLTRSHYTNMIKAGIFLESRHPFMFDTYNASNIQSKFYAAHTNDWYDIVNSTVDYNNVVTVPNQAESRFASVIHLFSENPYLLDRIWVGTDSDIVQYELDAGGNLILEKTIRPGGGIEELFVWDIFVVNEDDIYVVAEEKESQVGHIFRTIDAGVSWTDLDTINLPQKIYKFTILSGNKIAGTEDGVFYSDNNFGTWFPGNLSLSPQVGDSSPSIAAFSARIRNIEITTFLIAESDRWFYTSGSGQDWFALGGQMTTNGATIINKVVRFKNLTWIGTDKGLYNDGNSILSDSVQFGLEGNLEDTSSSSADLNISDIDFGVDALYCSAGDKIYRFLDGEWLSYVVDEVSGIHKILLREGVNDYLVVVSHNLIKTIDVTPGIGVFG